MADIFLKIFNMSVSACWIVLAVILFRAVLKKAPKWVNCVLWGIAGLRLVLPFSFESILSLIPSAEFVPQELIHSNSSVDVSGTEIFNYVGNNPVSYDLGISNGSVVFTEITAPEGNYVNPLLIITSIAAIVWAVGIIALLIYTLVSFLRLRSKIGTAVLLKDNIYQSENISSPFVLGVIKPKIYLPFYMNERDIPPVVAHEKAHIQRKDYLWKPLGFLILTLHWFNPLVWLGYVLLCRDIELACDEKVVKKLNNEQRADYSQALLTCSVNRRMIAACPLAFGEVGVKDRVKSILNYKKPAFWVIVTAVVLCLALAVGFLTNPVNLYVYNSRYETGKCLYSYVVSADKETENNELVFDITSDGKVYKTYGDGTTDELGVLKESDYTSETLKEALKNQDEKLNIGNIKNAYELSDYIFLQKSNGTVYLVSLFSDGKIMSVFKLKRTGDCDPLKSDFEKFTWNYQPMLSHTAYSFYSFSFDIGYTHIVASCDNGKMKNLEADKQPEDKTLRFEKGQHIYWTPDEGVIENIPSSSKVTFRVFNGEEEIYTSTVIFECLSRDIALAEFAIYLAQSDGLRLFEKDGALYFAESIATPNEFTEKILGSEYPEKYNAIHYSTAEEYKAAHPEKDDNTLGGIHIGEVYAEDLIEYLNSRKWKPCSAPWSGLSSPGSVQFVISDDCRVDVYKKKNIFSRAYAVVTKNGEETYYKAKADDYAEAKSILKSALKNTSTDIDVLKAKYPHFFDISTDGGLTVYVWQMAEENYRCYLANTFMEAISDNSFMYSTDESATVEEMRAILSTYNIEQKDITVQGIRNPLSSYYYELDEAYQQKVKTLFSDVKLQQEFEATVSYANYAEYNKLFADALNRDDMNRNLYLPLYCFDTLNNLEQFKETYGNILTMDSGYDEIPSFNDATSKYDSAFFNENSLVLVYVNAGSGSFRFGIENVVYNENFFGVYIKQTNNPESYSMDMAGWFITLAVPDSLLENCNEFVAFRENTVNLYNGKNIPNLTVQYGAVKTEAVKGTLTWTSEAENGTMQTINADSSHPTALMEHLLEQALTVNTTAEKTKIAQLRFDNQPDKVSVNGWYVYGDGKTKEFDVQTDSVNILLNDTTETAVYEIVATWNSSEKYYGTVRYSFCVVADDTDKNGEYVRYGNDDQYILVHKDNTYGSFEQSYSIGQSVRLRHSDIITSGNSSSHKASIYDYNVTLEKVLTGDTAKQFIKENCTNSDEEEFLFEGNDVYLARVNISYNDESEISNHKPVNVFLSAVDSNGNYVATENRLEFPDYKYKTTNGAVSNWYAVFVPEGTDAKLAFVIGSLFEAPGAVAAVLFDTNSEKTDIVNSSQFVESSAAAYYNLLYSDNSDLATAIKQITKQTSDKALLRNEVSVALGKIKALLPDTFSEAAKEYMAAKLFYYSVGLILNNEYGQITSSDFVVAEQKEIDGYLVCKVNCTVNYRTAKHGSDTFTASKAREQLQIVVKNTENPEIIDCYNEGKTSSFDMSIRTYGLDLYESKNWLDKTDKNTLSEKLTDTCIGVFERFVITQAN